MPQNEHDQQKKQRKDCTDSIVQSSAKNKIVVAGAGTGKSFTFKELLSTKRGDNLALTFINNLANDLRKDLHGLAESYTFHGFCKRLLHLLPVDGINSHFHYYPKLSQIVESDAAAIGKGVSNFDEAFHTLADDQRIDFFLERGNYYNAVGHDDAVFRVLKHFQSGAAAPPAFAQIVVDEYQDFNAMEVAFIDELEKTSPILIAGDDDQAIYNFKHASPDHIRAKSKHRGFQRFELPFCSRCTKVIVDAVHDVTTQAKRLGKLKGRIEKNYYCFLPDKEADSAKYPKIIHARCSTHTRKAPYVAKYIEKIIGSITAEEIADAKSRHCPCVLIAGPSHYTKQIYEHLRPKFANIDYPEKKSAEIDILEGYKILMEDPESNLGWRVVLECSGSPGKSKIIADICQSGSKLAEALADGFKRTHLEVTAILKKFKAGQDLSRGELSLVLKMCGHSVEELKNAFESNEEETEEADGDGGISIKITTVNGSKGLAANHVFLVGMNDGDFPHDPNNSTDNEICQFIVGLTRTRKVCHLISNRSFGAEYGKHKSLFIDWLNPTRISSVDVNAEYFRTH